jgi:hypothetical protein
LEDQRATIAEYAPLVGNTSHAHNIVSLSLRMIAEACGVEEANRAVRDFKLEEKGWSQQ